MQDFKHPCSWTSMVDFIICNLCKEGTVCVICLGVCNAKHPTKHLLSSGRSIRPGLKAFWFLPPTSPVSPPGLLLFSNVLFYVCFSKNVGVEREEGLMQPSDVWEKALTKSQRALTILFPCFSCHLFRCLLSSTPLSHPFKIQ